MPFWVIVADGSTVLQAYFTAQRTDHAFQALKAHGPNVQVSIHEIARKEPDNEQ